MGVGFNGQSDRCRFNDKGVEDRLDLCLFISRVSIYKRVCSLCQNKNILPRSMFATMLENEVRAWCVGGVVGGDMCVHMCMCDGMATDESVAVLVSVCAHMKMFMPGSNPQACALAMRMHDFLELARCVAGLPLFVKSFSHLYTRAHLFTCTHAHNPIAQAKAIVADAFSQLQKTFSALLKNPTPILVPPPHPVLAPSP